MSITDELRKWAEDNTLQDTVLTTYPPQHAVHGVLETLLRIADCIDAEHQKCIDAMWEDAKSHLSDESLTEQGWIRLPLDADGEYIHIGDEMEYGKAHGRVIALMLSNYPKKWGGGLHWGIQLEGEHAPTALDSLFRHYHVPTVEDVLREFGIDWEHESDCEDRAALLKEYAAKMREVLGE